MEFRLFLLTLRRGRIILFGAVLLGVLAAGAHAFSTPPSYQSTARLYVSVRTAANLTDLAQASALGEQVVGNYAQLAGTPYVLTRAAETSGLDVTAAQLETSVTATVSADTSFLNITAQSDSPSDAARIANAVASSLIVAVDDLAPSTSGSTAVLQLSQVQPASVPSAPISGGRVTEVLLGALIGLLVGAVVLALYARLSPRFQNVGQVVDAVGLDLIGAVPFDRRARSGRVSELRGRSRARYGAFRALRATMIGTGLLSEPGVTIAVTSSSAREGRSSVAAGLAVAIAATGRAVLLIDTDMSRHDVSTMFGLQAAKGLTDVLNGDAALDDCIVQTTVDGVRVLPSGAPRDDADELVESGAMRQLLGEAGASTIVIIDTPPLLAASYSVILAKRADHVLMVVDARVSREGQIPRVLALLSQLQIRPVGVVVNRVPRAWSDSAVRAQAAYSTGLQRTKQ